ncbi:hypothetical protein H257_06101 [Aphanomyces astaci]|uniref:Uncharacterized protein n=1 Tax=Aphanomyces astaci TaxID=112090 RepID=W4GLP4_APHAT|nr:hypothetical protein H257_06101 [Aphanomyces astaci]ETV80572.1 hypothetical protein H257_06101 [Aphanomyces astaci]|eukprot:XP_009829519.1 hypothetical protein H257_06101 [Aphanomyces astaci]
MDNTKTSSLEGSDKKPSQSFMSASDDIALLNEVSFTRPWESRRSAARLAWEEIAKKLTTDASLSAFKSGPARRKRTEFLLKKHVANEHASLRKSGSTEDISSSDNDNNTPHTGTNKKRKASTGKLRYKKTRTKRKSLDLLMSGVSEGVSKLSKADDELKCILNFMPSPSPSIGRKQYYSVKAKIAIVAENTKANESAYATAKRHGKGLGVSKPLVEAEVLTYCKSLRDEDIAVSTKMLIVKALSIDPSFHQKRVVFHKDGFNNTSVSFGALPLVFARGGAVVLYNDGNLVRKVFLLLQQVQREEADVACLLAGNKAEQLENLFQVPTFASYLKAANNQVVDCKAIPTNVMADGYSLVGIL